MQDITRLLANYREAARQLWNAYYLPLAAPKQDWDVRDEFDIVARRNFSTWVLRPLQAQDRPVAKVGDYEFTVASGTGCLVVGAVLDFLTQEANLRAGEGRR